MAIGDKLPSWPIGHHDGFGTFWHEPAHVLVGIFAGRRQKPFGAFLTQSGH
jgi:hypothetical protein